MWGETESLEDTRTEGVDDDIDVGDQGLEKAY